MPGNEDVVELRRHIERILEERDRRYTERAAAQERALDALAEQYRQDKAQANEWRGALDDQRSTLTPRVVHDALELQVRELRDTVKGITASKQGGTENSAMLIKVLGAIISLLVLYGLLKLG